jgi:hypothetical protein
LPWDVSLPWKATSPQRGVLAKKGKGTKTCKFAYDSKFAKGPLATLSRTATSPGDASLLRTEKILDIVKRIKSLDGSGPILTYKATFHHVRDCQKNRVFGWQWECWVTTIAH